MRESLKVSRTPGDRFDVVGGALDVIETGANYSLPIFFSEVAGLPLDRRYRDEVKSRIFPTEPRKTPPREFICP